MRPRQWLKQRNKALRNYLNLCLLFVSGTIYAQHSDQVLREIDSLQDVIANTDSDTVKIKAYYQWDNHIYISDPELDHEINRIVLEICDKNINTPGLSEAEYRLFYHCKAISLNILGLVLVDLSDFRTAHDYFQEAIAIAEGLGDNTLMSGPTNNLGMIFRHQGSPAKGLKYYQKGMELDDENDVWSQAIYMNNIGLCYSDMGKTELAINFYRESLELSRASENRQNEANTLINLGEIFFLNNEFDSALYYYDLSYKINLEIHNTTGYTHNLERIGTAYLGKGDAKMAVAYCEKGLELLGDANLLENEAQCHRCLYRAYRRLNKNGDALEHLEEFKMLDDSLLGQHEVESITEARKAIEYEKTRMADSLDFALIHSVQEVQHASDIKEEKNKRYLLYGGFGVFAILLVVSYRNYRRKKRDHETISEQHHDLEEKNQEITDSISYARRIQEALLPNKQKLEAHFSSSFVMYLPKDIVAGDFYWIEETQKSVYFAVADCTGHGVPGAMVSVLCSNALTRCVRELSLQSPGEILDQTREIIISHFEDSTEDVKDGMDIGLCRLDKDTNELTFAGAHNGLYLIRNGRLEEFKADKQPVSSYAMKTAFKTRPIATEKGDVIYLYSDGYPDQFGGEKGKKLKSKNFKELLVSIQDKPVNEHETILYEKFIDWRGKYEQLDDVCVMGIQL